MHWHRAIAEYAADGTAYAIATVLATTGSAPRDSGTKMVITALGTDDSIGGGQLEHQVCEQARALIARGENTTTISHFPLAAATAQCCGGSVTILLECFAHPVLRAAVFGAGHVGRRVVRLLADMNAQVEWWDSRDEQADESGVACTVLTSPAQAMTRAVETGAHPLVLTHDHQLDYALVSAALSQGADGIGLIGSETKWQRFSARLSKDGFSPDELARVRCPIGADLPGKHPGAVAVAVVAELLRLTPAIESSDNNLSWRQIKEQLVQTHDAG
ncbi:MAG: xanthine dehydrogenase accessory protein XdhC [Pseudomonadaceae bacterium]|nr:xanthine dehydrogenase accessory protein XdhC [Pseudomonadaceae bacterium]